MKTNPTPLTKEQELDKLLGLFLSGNQQYHILTKLLTFDELEYVKKIISGAIIYSQAQAIKQERSRVVEIINKRPAMTLTNPENNHPANAYKLIDRKDLLKDLSNQTTLTKEQELTTSNNGTTNYVYIDWKELYKDEIEEIIAQAILQERNRIVGVVRNIVIDNMSYYKTSMDAGANILEALENNEN